MDAVSDQLGQCTSNMSRYPHQYVDTPAGVKQHWHILTTSAGEGSTKH